MCDGGNGVYKLGTLLKERIAPIVDGSIACCVSAEYGAPIIHHHNGRYTISRTAVSEN